jgi:ketosteroid isomerase-like protein
MNGNGGDPYQQSTGGNMRIWRLLPIALLAIVACAPSPPDPAILEQEVRQADVDFDRALADGDVNTTLEGREAVVNGWAPFLDEDSGLTLRWNPTDVEVAASGDLGVSRGDYRMTQISEDGSVSVGVGSYVTVWRRSEDGAWRAALDIGTPAKPAESE